MAEVTEAKTMSENDSSLLSQCMDYTKQLASQGKDFKFSLSLPSGFNFSLDFTQEKLLPSRIPEKKRKSPSTLRRNAQRRKEFQQKKTVEIQAGTQHLDIPAKESKIKCDHCQEEFKTKNILNKHIDEIHLAIMNTGECEKQTKSSKDLGDHKKYEHEIEQLDGNSEIKESDEEYLRKSAEYDRKLEEECKAEGNWCYECSDIFLNRVVLKRHMHNDHKIEIYPDINIMIHGGW